MKEKFIDYALMFKALSDPNRLLILEYLLDGEKCACVILDQLQITQSTLSHHMKTLTENNLVIARKEGKWTHYSLNKTSMIELKDLLDSFASSKQDTSTERCC